MERCYNQANSTGCPDAGLENDLRSCSDIGFKYIELRFDMLHRYLTGHSREELVQLFLQLGVKPVSFNALYLDARMFSAAAPSELTDSLEETLDLASELGGLLGVRDVIAVAPLYAEELHREYSCDWEEMKSRCAYILRRLAERGREADLRFGLELVGSARCAVRALVQAEEIVELANDASVGYVLDTYNIFQYDNSGDFSAIARLPKEKIFMVHVNNADENARVNSSQVNRCFCDKGIVDVREFMRCVKATGYDGLVSVETVRPEYWRLDVKTIVAAAYDSMAPLFEYPHREIG